MKQLRKPRIIAVVNQKGGVGKSTSCANLGAALVRWDRSVLLIDLDPQANLTHSVLGKARAESLEFSIYEVLEGSKNIMETMIMQPPLEGPHGRASLLPSSITLAGADIKLGGVPGREKLLQDAMGAISFDYILIDCPPSLGLLTLNALTYAREVMIPLQLEYLALQGLDQLLDTVALVQRRLNKDLRITGIIGTRYNRRDLNNQAVALIRKRFPDLLFKTLIRENIALAEAPAQGKSIFAYEPKSNGAADYDALAQEILAMEKRVENA